MRAFVVRELIVIARRPAVVVVIAAYTGLLASFALLWSGGVHGLAGSAAVKSHSLAVLSRLPVMSRRPSGLIARHPTASW